MGTKSKSRLLVIIWLILLTYGLNGVGLLLFHGDKYIGKNYFDSEIFQGELDRFVSVLANVELNHLTKSEVEKELTVSPVEIENYRGRLGNLFQQIAQINDEYQYQIDNATIEGDQTVSDSLKAERDKKIEDIKKIFSDDAYAKAAVLKEKTKEMDKYFNSIESLRQDFARQEQSFKFYFKDVKTGEVFTNLMDGETSEDINKGHMLFVKNYSSLSNMDYINGIGYRDDPYNDSEEQYLTSVMKRLGSTFRGTIAVPQSLPADSTVLLNYQRFNHQKYLFYIMVISGIISLLISAFLKRKWQIRKLFYNEKLQNYYNRIPADVSLTILILSCFVTLVLITDDFMPFFVLYNFVEKLVMMGIAVTVTLLQFNWFISMVKKHDELLLWQRSLIFKSLQTLRDAFLNIGLGWQSILVLGIVFAFGGFAAFSIVVPPFIPIYIAAIFVIGLPLLIIILKRIGYFNRIVENTSNLVKGDFEKDLPVKGKSVLAKLAENVNTLKRGVAVSQEKQAKSERLKTELITNVSHDLRTPLTSIITYSELLKAPGLSDDERNAYIEVIDRKSKRLKVLIDDLFEASKMASGAVEIVKERVDLVQLLQQALAENDERINASSLQFRVSKPEEPIYAIVDGQKLWRVFDNLIGNILKYSLENTRVYITIDKQNDRAVLTFKNITRYELSENIDELFERFKRGDTSRHTEGSGLGLAIAKSIVDLHGGGMDIEIDGDLFKVTVTLDIA